MLKKVFISIQKNKDDWLGIRQGKHLEDRLKEELRKNSFIPLRLKLVENETRKSLVSAKQKSQWQTLKKEILQKGNNELIKNNFSASIHNTYFRSPYGSQNFPDFLVFTSNMLFR